MPLRFRRSRDERGASSLHVLPMLNLVSILVPFLLMAIQLAGLAAMDVMLEAGAGKDKEMQGARELGPRLTLSLNRQGIVLSAPDADDMLLPCAEQPCTLSGYDFESLGHRLIAEKALTPHQETISIEASEDLPYEVLVRAMDVAREGPSHLRPGERPGLLFSTPILSSSLRDGEAQP